MEPWPHLLERAAAWDTGESELVLKARQLGVSWLLAAFAVYRARQTGALILILSQGQSEAYELLGKCRFINDELPQALRLRVVTDSAGELAFEGGGRIIALPATQRAGRGYTASLVIADEAAFHPWAALNYAAYKPTLDGGGQLLMVSTANGAAGNFFHDLYWQTERGETGFAAVFIPWHARPGRDAEWLRRERAAFVGLPAEFDQEYPNTPSSAFVQLTGLVYGADETGALVFDPQANVINGDPVPWEACNVRYAAYDLGGGDPTAVVLLGAYRRSGEGLLRVHQYGEMYQRTGAPTVEALYAYMARWAERAPFAWVEGDPAPGGEVVAASLRALGLPVRAALNNRGEGIGLQGQYLRNRWLTLNAQTCGESIREFSGYRWLNRVDPNSKDRYATGTPVDNHADAMDARRYGLMGVYRDTMQRGVTQRPAYSEVVI